MINFIIPVKSKKVTVSWEKFSKIFERTLKSVAKQTSQNFRIIVVCHEKPDVDFTHPNLEIIQVDFEPPNLIDAPQEKHNGLKEEDKSKKILAGLEYIKKYKQDYVMVVDADDCISNKIVSVVEQQKENIPGWYFNQGYVYIEGDKFISLNKKDFNSLCGTCIIIRPDLIKHIFKNRPHLLYAHHIIELTDNTCLEPFPIPGAIYSMANGENHYMSNSMVSNLKNVKLFSITSIKGIIRKLKKYRLKLLSKKIQAEFGVSQIL